MRPKNLTSIKVLEKCGINRIGALDDVSNREKNLIFQLFKPKTKKNFTYGKTSFTNIAYWLVGI
ncbi:hypothetical protein [Riemerella columbipharyngis]|uniref:Uncharacterized protein n=1 Tax=Riemerella columbipharyngis TaxID=1071918 RepID=A0A1G7DB25_9FLAO|nr:hypothetical protein [Riemerella columbipharyngis]SDE47945.1 hypothetical protein SAMN05421544_11051 [Riemerella columbipharyngis]